MTAAVKTALVLTGCMTVSAMCWAQQSDPYPNRDRSQYGGRDAAAEMPYFPGTYSTTASYRRPLIQHSSVFGYIELPGEPALATSLNTHPLLSMENQTDGLEPASAVTLGYMWRNLKFEGSTFHSRPPEDKHFVIGSSRPFGVTSGRLSFNLSPNWALQISRGQRSSPDQLDPNDEIRRTTLSAIHNYSFDRNNWQTTVAIGRSAKMNTGMTNAYLLESVLKLANIHTYFGRFEHTSNDELFNDSDTLHGQSFNANKFTLGYVYEVAATGPVKFSIGALASKSFIPQDQFALFGHDPASYKIFMRVVLQYR
jgi:hypothetical protein